MTYAIKYHPLPWDRSHCLEMQGRIQVPWDVSCCPTNSHSRCVDNWEKHLGCDAPTMMPQCCRSCRLVDLKVLRWSSSPALHSITAEASVTLDHPTSVLNTTMKNWPAASSEVMYSSVKQLVLLWCCLYNVCLDPYDLNLPFRLCLCSQKPAPSSLSHPSQYLMKTIKAAHTSTGQTLPASLTAPHKASPHGK